MIGAQPEPSYRCSVFSAMAAEPILGTASRVTNWLLLEQPGPWGQDPLIDSRLPGAVALALRDRARAARVRVVLLRRAGEAASRQRVFLAHSAPGAEFLLGGDVATPEEILDIDLGRLALGERPSFGAPVVRPVYLVCTNGRHDVCCAERGRPVYRAMRAHAPGRVWECSHIGGDRFAANVVAVPAGAYFGRVTPRAGVDLIRAVDGGVLDLDHFRGRSAYPMPVQAAESFLRKREALVGLDDVRYLRRVRTAEDELVVSFASAEGPRYDVTIGIDRAIDGRLLTCGSTARSSPAEYELREISMR